MHPAEQATLHRPTDKASLEQTPPQLSESVGQGQEAEQAFKKNLARINDQVASQNVLPELTIEDPQPKALVSESAKANSEGKKSETGEKIVSTNQNGQKIDYVYNQEGKLVESRVDNGKSVAIWRDGVLVENRYHGGPTCYLSPEGVVTRVKDANGAWTTYRYEDGKLAEVQNSNGINARFIDGTWHRIETINGKEVDCGTTELKLQVLGTNDTVTLTNRTVSGFELYGIGHASDESRLDPAYRDTTVKALSDAIEKNDKATVERICTELNKLSPENRNELLLKYQHDTGRNVHADLRKHEMHLADAILKRQDPEAGLESARVIDSIQSLKKGDAGAAKRLRESLAQMDEKQVQKLERETPSLSKQLEQLNKDGKISEETYKSCLLYVKHPAGTAERNSKEFNKQLAEIVLSPTIVHDPNNERPPVVLSSVKGSERLELLREALGTQNSPEQEKAASQARSELANRSLSGDFNLVFSDNTQRMEARDILKDGKASLATRILQNEGNVYNNPQNVERVIREDMTAAEHSAFMHGQYGVSLMSAGDKAKFMAGGEFNAESLKIKGLTAEEIKTIKQDCEFYRDMHNALDVTSKTAINAITPGQRKRDLRAWEDLAANGKPTLETKLADHYGVFRNSDVSEVKNTLKNMSREDWEKLKGDPIYRQRVRDSINELKDGAAGIDKIGLDHLHQQIDRMVAAKTYEEATRTRVSDLGANPKAEDVIRALQHMPEEEREDIRRGGPTKLMLEHYISKMEDPAMKEVATSMKDRIATDIVDEPVKPSSSEQLLLAAKDFKSKKQSEEELHQKIDQFVNDPAKQSLVRELRSGNPTSSEAKRFDEAMRKVLGSAYAEQFRPRLANELTIDAMMKQDVSVSHRTSRAGSTEIATVKLDKVCADVKYLSNDEKASLVGANSEQLKQMMPHLTAEQRQLVVEIAKNSKADPENSGLVQTGVTAPEDMIRSYILDPNQNYDLAKQALENVSPPQRNQISKEYARKYGRNMMEDLSHRTPEGVKHELLNLASPEANKFEQAMREAEAIDKALRSGMFNETVRSWDSSGGRLDQLMSELAREKDPAKREELKVKLAGAITDESASAEQVSAAILETIYVTAAISTAPLSISATAATVGLGAAGAGGKPLLRRAVMGEMYGNRGQDVGRNVGTDAVTGGVSWGGAGAIAGGAGVMMERMMIRNEIAKLVAAVGRDRAAEILASVSEQYAAGQNPQQGSQAQNATKWEYRKFGELLAKAAARGIVTP